MAASCSGCNSGQPNTVRAVSRSRSLTSVMWLQFPLVRQRETRTAPRRAGLAVRGTGTQGTCYPQETVVGLEDDISSGTGEQEGPADGGATGVPDEHDGGADPSAEGPADGGAAVEEHDGGADGGA
jgi:hypothetical protein